MISTGKYDETENEYHVDNKIFNPFKDYKPQIGVAILNWQWMKMTRSRWQLKKIVLLKQFPKHFLSKTP